LHLIDELAVNGHATRIIEAESEGLLGNHTASVLVK
jgi:hypothetical protein